MKSLDQLTKQQLPIFEDHLAKWTWAPQFSNQLNSPIPYEFKQAICYSLFSGGKRFRPMVSFAMAETLNVEISQVIPLAMSIEAIHTYSLVHDDLPCMDNDDLRRGLPTNHKKFSEDTALLVGDSLLSSAFEILAHGYQQSPSLGLKLVHLISRCAGGSGMVGGQFLDLKIDQQQLTHNDLNLIHRLKTGALIAASGIGVGIISENGKQNIIEEFSWLLGFVFQLADDFLDFDPEKNEKTNLVRLLGRDKAQALMLSTNERLISLVQQIEPHTNPLTDLINLNFTRLK